MVTYKKSNDLIKLLIESFMGVFPLIYRYLILYF